MFQHATYAQIVSLLQNTGMFQNREFFRFGPYLTLRVSDGQKQGFELAVAVFRIILPTRQLVACLYNHHY